MQRVLHLLMYGVLILGVYANPASADDCLQAVQTGVQQSVWQSFYGLGYLSKARRPSEQKPISPHSAKGKHR